MEMKIRTSPLNGDEIFKLQLELSGGQCHTPEAGSRRPSYTPYGDQAAVLICRLLNQGSRGFG